MLDIGVTCQLPVGVTDTHAGLLAHEWTPGTDLPEGLTPNGGRILSDDPVGLCWANHLQRRDRAGLKPASLLAARPIEQGGAEHECYSV